MISKKILLPILLITLVLSISCVGAVDSSNWKTVKVGDVNFKIPPQYQDGNLNKCCTDYHYKDLNTFGILCVDDYIPNNYECWYNFKGKNLTIGSHDVAYFTQYNSYANHDVSLHIFSPGDLIYCICWNGGQMMK